MSIDSDDEILAAARAGFQSEAAELLVQFEQALLALEQSPADAEAMNSAFRAAHTMKGGAGLFGCDALGHFTHEVESLMDDLRSGAVAMGEETMTVLLASRDQLECLLAEMDAAAPSASVAEASERLAERLRGLRGPADVADGGLAAAERGAAVPAAEEGSPHRWFIELRMGPDALRNGLDPLSFVRYLGDLGTLASVRTDAARVPNLQALDPEGCWLDFAIELHSSHSREEVASTFDFLAEDCTLAISERGAAAPTAALPDAGPLAAPAAALSVAAEAAEVPVPVASQPGAEPEKRSAPRAGEDTRFIRVRADKLDALIDLIGELVIASSGAQMVAQQERSPRFSEVAMRIHDLVQHARDGALGLRMVPIGETFARFQRIVRDVSKQLGKNVALQVTGGDTEMDKSMVELIADPLTHLVRNSLDHGIETAEGRLAAGKPEQGRLGLHAYHESGSIVIEVSDDGRGLDRNRILAKAVQQGLVSADAVLEDEAVWQLIFRPGFSTAEAVTSLSGRGVGMDVVKSNVEALRGHIKIASQAGLGTTMQIRLPLTLAIIDGFLTSVGGISYVLPLDTVAECIEVPAGCAATGAGPAGCFDLRGEMLPFVDLRRLFRVPGEAAGRRSLVVVRSEAGRLGLLVDRLHGEHQTVIKPLASIFRDLPGLAGSTILGSGEVALILDVAALERLAHGRSGTVLLSN